MSKNYLNRRDIDLIIYLKFLYMNISSRIDNDRSLSKNLRKHMKFVRTYITHIIDDILDEVNDEKSLSKSIKDMDKYIPQLVPKSGTDIKYDKILRDDLEDLYELVLDSKCKECDGNINNCEVRSVLIRNKVPIFNNDNSKCEYSYK